MLTLSSKTNTEITWGITLVLMFRSVGSILFGIAADRYGRKWPFIVNNVLFIILELVSPSYMQHSPLKISFMEKPQPYCIFLGVWVDATWRSLKYRCQVTPSALAAHTLGWPSRVARHFSTLRNKIADCTVWDLYIISANDDGVESCCANTMA